MKERLSPLMVRFVEEYIKDPSDGGEAYMRAANTTNKKSASTQASKLLKLQKVKNALEAHAAETLGARKVAILRNVDFWLDVRDGKNPGQELGASISKDAVLTLLEDHGYEKGQDLYDEVNDLLAIKVSPIKLADRMKASDYLGKYMQMFVEKKEVDVSGQVQIVDDIK